MLLFSLVFRQLGSSCNPPFTGTFKIVFVKMFIHASLYLLFGKLVCISRARDLELALDLGSCSYRATLHALCTYICSLRDARLRAAESALERGI